MLSSFFAANRLRLANTKQGLYVIGGYVSMQQSGDMAAAFLQEGNFWWLTGIEEPGWTIIIDGFRQRSVLVAPARSRMSEVFDGGLSYDDMLKISGANEVIRSDEFEAYLRGLAKKHTVAYTVYDKTPYEFTVNPIQKDLHGTLERIFPSVQLCNDTLKKLRAIKQTDEITAIKKAVRLTVESFEHVKTGLANYSHEYVIQAEFDHRFGRVGATHAYAPIVAAGNNACTLHYGKNEAKLRANQLVLMDIGARIDGYAADITRTYVKGGATKRQREIHQAVEAAHYEIIKMLEPQLPVEEYIRGVDACMKQALINVGLIKSDKDDAGYRKYFPHAISHGLGVDVHDSLGGAKYFQDGMVLTVEPGIYIPEEGIGVRIEDDILITKTGHLNLSSKLSTALD